MLQIQLIIAFRVLGLAKIVLLLLSYTNIFVCRLLTQLVLLYILTWAFKMAENELKFNLSAYIKMIVFNRYLYNHLLTITIYLFRQFYDCDMLFVFFRIY